jgi:hemolysin III
MSASMTALEQQEQQPLWPKFAEAGKLSGERSRDGSTFVTDEVFNAASHLVGCMLSILGTAVLIAHASAKGNPWAIVAYAIYGFSLILLFGASFLHHGITGSERLNSVLRGLDYVSIYVLIAGTATPLCLICLHQTWIGWVFFGSCWGLAAFGITMQISCHHDAPMALPKWASMTCYVTLGWFGAFLAIPAYSCITLGGAMLFLAGGLCYTGGGVIFTLEFPNPMPGKFGFHELWHCFVLAGAGLHWLMMFYFVLPVTTP